MNILSFWVILNVEKSDINVIPKIYRTSVFKCLEKTGLALVLPVSALSGCKTGYGGGGRIILNSAYLYTIFWCVEQLEAASVRAEAGL